MAFLDKKQRLFTLQLLGWGVILTITLFWSLSSRDGVIDSFGLIVFSANLLALVVIYIVNYLFIIPTYLFSNNRRRFFIANLLLIILLLFISYGVNRGGLLDNLRPDDMPVRLHRPTFIFLLRDSISYVLMIGLVTALRLSERLQRSEEALKEAESARIRAELANLRSQINPHFLLNTLNNIYALTAIDADKAQKTIKELSNLLRYVLYDNLNDRVSLTGEVEFLKTYIELMSIRLPLKMSVKTDFVVADGCSTMIAPLIFISLIENAFKHSVDSSGQGFIDIYFEDNAERGEVTLSIKNSNHAKQDEDKSGHGVGLEQVKRRLELLYPDRYEWRAVADDKVYSSTLILKV